jgi:dUTP pyrophosphatase
MSSPIILGKADDKFQQMAQMADAQELQAEMFTGLVQMVTENVIGNLLNSISGLLYFDENGNHVSKDKSNGFEPEKQNLSDSGYDLKSPITFSLIPGERRLVKLGIGMLLMSHMDAFILPRSGHASKNGITITNSPGLVDSSYTYEWGVIFQNTGDKVWNVNKGDRVAQVKFQLKGVNMQFKEFEGNLEELREKIRARSAGFGSTGV